MPYHRPGQYVDEVLLATTVPVNTATAVAAFVAPAKRGPVTPVKVSNWTDAQKAFGKFNGVAADDVLRQSLYNCFQAGGRDIYAVRAVGAGATVATLPFLLKATPGPGAAALDITALNPGVWGNRIYVEVSAGSTPDRFSLTIREVPTGAAITNSQIVDTRWNDLSLNPNDARYAVSIVNSATSGSYFINLAVRAGYVYAANDVIAPSTVIGGDKLAGGTDGAAPLSTDIMAGVYTLDVVTQPLVINLPGVTDLATITSLTNYVDPNRTRDDVVSPGRGDVFAVLDTDPGTDSDTAVSKVSTYPLSDYLAAFYPPVIIADPTNNTPGSTKLVSVGPLIVGRFMATDATRGFFKSPAGNTDGLLSQVVALDPAAVLKNPNLDRLNDGRVNAIKLVPNRGFCIFGSRTLRSDFVTRYIAPRRTLIAARAELLDATSFAPFENNDSFLWSAITIACEKVLRELWTAGALKGGSAEQAFYVKCNADNNPASAVEQGEVHTEVGLALQRPAEFFVLQIGQFNGGVVVTTES